MLRKFYGKFLPELGFVHESPGDDFHTFYAGGGDRPLEFFSFDEEKKTSSQRHTHSVLDRHARRSGSDCETRARRWRDVNNFTIFASANWSPSIRRRRRRDSPRCRKISSKRFRFANCVQAIIRRYQVTRYPPGVRHGVQRRLPCHFRCLARLCWRHLVLQTVPRGGSAFACWLKMSPGQSIRNPKREGVANKDR